MLFIKIFLLTLLFGGILFALGYWQDILPLKQRLLTSQQNEEKLTRQLHELVYQELALEDKMGQLPATKARLTEWQKRFIKKNDLNTLLKEIVALGKLDNLRVQLFTLTVPNQERNYVKQPIKVGVIGDYNQITHFINHIASLPWLVVVGNFLLLKVPSDSIAPLFSAELEFDIYYLTSTKLN